jgi:hypothetical protein
MAIHARFVPQGTQVIGIWLAQVEKQRDLQEQKSRHRVQCVAME